MIEFNIINIQNRQLKQYHIQKAEKNPTQTHQNKILNKNGQYIISNIYIKCIYVMSLLIRVNNRYFETIFWVIFGMNLTSNYYYYYYCC